MKKMFFTFLLLTQYLIGFSQFFDDFSDGNFTSNPNWIGDLGVFEVDTSYKLHLIDSASNTTYLSTTSHAIINGCWQFDVKMDFSPSTSNYSKVYLISNSQNLDSNLNGYYVKIGGQSGDIDDVSLHVQNGSSSTEIIDGTDGITASNPDLTVKVTRDDLGNWALFVDTSNTYFSEGIAYDTTHLSADYFGIYCKYTSTRADKFWFDNFNISGTFISDTTKPFVQSFFVTSSNSILINFSEGINSTTALNTNNYTTNNGIGNPNSITVVTPKSIELFFSNSFVSPNNYQLSINNIEDLSQNIMPPFDTTFTYFLVSHNDIIINEIFADPTPSIGLPEFEYLELYNATNTAINLTDWSITIGTTEKTFPSSIIEPDSFIILVKEDVLDSFPPNISKVGFSSISLTNGGGDVVLKDEKGATINAISYTDKWYNDENKNDGGWSIERVNPNLFCEGKNNWRASVSNIGGTPGKQNSVFGETLFIEEFRITKAIIIDSNKVQVHFNKSLDSLELIEAANSLFEIGGIIPIKNSPIAPFFNSITLTFDFEFLENITYNISAFNLFDCSGNLLSNTLSFGIPDSTLENEIIINEVLFNPKDGGVDYVEIYNNSSSFFDLSKLNIANYFEFGNQIATNNPKTITEEIILFAPKSYLVLTTDSAKVKSQYYCKNPYNFIEAESMPTFSNDEGTICIAHQSLNQIIDAFAYAEDMHFPLLETTDGVSLERLSFNSNDWHSSASTVGFGTPTYKNSQQLIIESIGEITIEPKSFSPNNDGYKDICSINWNFNETNLTSTIKAFNDEGRLVKNILNNKMIGNNGSANWDGTDVDGLLLKTGMYIIWVEVFSENGNVERFKKVVVLSR